MSKPNFVVKDKDTNKEYWISRSICVIPIVFKIEDNIIYTLIEKRGKSVSNVGKWCCPCGYLDWNETLEEACVREVGEETGVQLNIRDVHFVSYNSSPNESRQNVGIRFCCFVPPYTELDKNKIVTKDEVDDIEWLRIGNFDVNGFVNTDMSMLVNLTCDVIKIDSKLINDRKWAFNHNELIIEVLTQYYKGNINVIVV